MKGELKSPAVLHEADIGAFSGAADRVFLEVVDDSILKVYCTIGAELLQLDGGAKTSRLNGGNKRIGHKMVVEAGL